MAWRGSHPRRIATPDEVQENRQQIEVIDGQIKQMTRTAEESALKLLQLQQERTNLLSLIDRWVPIKILRKIALRCVKWKIQTINGSIDEMVSMTEELTQKLLQLQREQANRLSFIATYHRLPSEILCEIAWHCLQIGMQPYGLNRVDAAMRYAVNGFKALWARIFVNYSSSPTKTVRGSSHYLQKLKSSKYIVCRDPRYLQQVLDRASPSLLTIKIHSSMLVTAFRVLAPFSTYIKILTIVAVSKTPQFHQFPQLDFRTLQHLYFNDRKGSCKDFMVHLLNAVQISGISSPSYHLCLGPHVLHPLLHHWAVRNAIELELIYRDKSNSSIPSVEIGTMPYLRSLTMSHTPCSFNGAYLPSLLYLDASCCDSPHASTWIDINDIPSQIRVLGLRDYTLHQQRTSPRHFPDLYELRLNRISNSNLMPESIMAPKLKTFCLVHRAPKDDYDVTPEVISFWLNGLPLRSPLLKHLILGFTVLALDIAPQMHQFHSLQTLEFISCWINEGVLAPLLTPSEQTTLFLPSLHTLTFYISYEIGHWSFEELQERWKVARPSLEVIVERSTLNPRLQKICAPDYERFLN